MIEVRDSVEKIGGDYTFTGIVVVKFNKISPDWKYGDVYFDGPERVVVQNKDGVLHIFNPTQLRKVLP